MTAHEAPVGSGLPGSIGSVISCGCIGWVTLVLLVRWVPGSHVHVVALMVHTLFGFLLWEKGEDNCENSHVNC